MIALVLGLTHHDVAFSKIGGAFFAEILFIKIPESARAMFKFRIECLSFMLLVECYCSEFLNVF